MKNRLKLKRAIFWFNPWAWPKPFTFRSEEVTLMVKNYYSLKKIEYPGIQLNRLIYNYHVKKIYDHDWNDFRILGRRVYYLPAWCWFIFFYFITRECCWWNTGDMDSLQTHLIVHPAGLSAGEDFKEETRSFREKQEPKFIGR